MITDFNDVFAPTLKQQCEQRKRDKALIKRAYNEKWCCTCKNYIAADPYLPGVVSAYPECKLGGLAIDSCEKYTKNKED